MEEWKWRNGPYQCEKLRQWNIPSFELFKFEAVSEDDRQSEGWIRVGQLASTIVEVLAFTALTGSLDANYLSEEDRGRRAEFDRAGANLIEGRVPSDGLASIGENASQEDIVVNEVEVVQGVLKERNCDFQPKASKKRKQVVVPKKFWNHLSLRKD